MSVYRSKQSGIVIQGAKLKNNCFSGIIRIPFQIIPGYSITEDDAEQLFTESEQQQNIESAVAEHEKSMQDTLQAYYDNEQQLLAQIEEIKSESKELQNDALSQWYDEERKLKKRIDELVKKIEELKSKVRPPIELNKAYCDELDRLLEEYGPITILHKVIKGDIDLGLIHSLDLGYLVHALTDGYTVKPKITFQERMKNLLESPQYNGLDFEMVAKEMAIVLKHEGWIKDEEA